MRITLDIEDDVLLAAKEIGRRNRISVGKVISNLARRSLTQPQAADARADKTAYGFRPLPGVPGKIVTDELINRLRDEEGI